MTYVFCLSLKDHPDPYINEINSDKIFNKFYLTSPAIQWLNSQDMIPSYSMLIWLGSSPRDHNIQHIHAYLKLNHFQLTTPVIHEYHTKDVILSLVNLYGITEIIAWSNKESLKR